MSRDIFHLHPIVRVKAQTSVRLCKERGVIVLIYFTYRSIEEQHEIWLKGRRGIEGEEKVTDADGGDSAHNYGAGFDSVPLKTDGRPWWDAPDEIWEVMAKQAEKSGLDCYLDKWGKYLPWDKGHCEEPGWELIKDYLLDGLSDVLKSQHRVA